MKALGVFLVSCTAHLITFGLCLWLGFTLNTFLFPRMSTLSVLIPFLAVHLLMIACLGFIKARRWGSRWNGAFGAGLVTAALVATLFVLVMMYGLSYPVQTRHGPPPFWTYMTDVVLQKKNAALWIAAPVVVWSFVSTIGYAAARARVRVAK